MYKIYKITNKINNKIYIGFTSKKLKERLSKHHRDAIYNKRKTILCHAIRKYGIENFEIKLLFKVNNYDKIIGLESECIKKYKTYYEEHGYNMTFGGEGTIGHKHSLETKQKMVSAHLGKKHSSSTKLKLSNLRKGNKNPNFGKVYTDEEKERWRKLLSGENGPRSKTFLVINDKGVTEIIKDRRGFCLKKIGRAHV